MNKNVQVLILVLMEDALVHDIHSSFKQLHRWS